MNRRWTILALALALVFAMGGCKKEEKKEEKPKDLVINVKKEEPEDLGAKNLLSGLSGLSEEAVGKRPVAVMVNNVEHAMPQYGIEEADIIFEIPVEGDLTRFMVIYGDYTKIPKVCAVRSCRSYFPTLSEGYDAFYVNWGVDETIRDYLNSLHLDQFDGMTFGQGLFGRDQDRLNSGYASEHTAYFDGTKFREIAEKDYRTDLDDEHNKPAFVFNEEEEMITPAGDACNRVDINFGAQTSAFDFDAEKKVYKKEMNGHPQIDANTDKQLEFTNVFIIETSITVRDETGHKDIECMGGDGSTAYYISNGAVQQVHWKKDGGTARSRLIFFDDSGNEITVNPGKTYIGVSYPGKESFQ